MYICLCNGITDRDIKSAAEQGICTMRELRRELGVGAQCGKCGKCAKQLLRSHVEDVTATPIPTIAVA